MATITATDDHGQSVTVKARVHDITETGACLESPQSFPCGSSVFVNLLKRRLMGTAIARHCTPAGSAYQIGLQFQKPLSKY